MDIRSGEGATEEIIRGQNRCCVSGIAHGEICSDSLLETEELVAFKAQGRGAMFTKKMNSAKPKGTEPRRGTTQCLRVVSLCTGQESCSVTYVCAFADQPNQNMLTGTQTDPNIIVHNHCSRAGALPVFAHIAV